MMDVLFETNPQDKSCDTRINITAQPLRITYDAVCWGGGEDGGGETEGLMMDVRSMLGGEREVEAFVMIIVQPMPA